MARDGHDRESGGPGGRHEVGPGIADARGSGIGNESYIASVTEHPEEPVEPGDPGMGVVADDRGGGTQVREETAGSARVLGGNDGDRPEHLRGASREVPEVAKRCGDDEEGCRVDLS